MIIDTFQFKSNKIKATAPEEPSLFLLLLSNNSALNLKRNPDVSKDFKFAIQRFSV